MATAEITEHGRQSVFHHFFVHPASASRGIAEIRPTLFADDFSGAQPNS
jgi:hypothetical protein